MIRSVLTLMVFILCGSAGEIAVSHGMKQVGEPVRMRPKELLEFLGRAFRSKWLLLGVPLMAASFGLLLVLLSWEPISFVIPASALSYVVGTFGAKYFLKEEVSALRWAGVILVCAGVTLVTAG